MHLNPRLLPCVSVLRFFVLLVAHNDFMSCSKRIP